MKIFPLPTNVPIVNILPIPRQSPYFAGCHNPGLILLILGNGEIETMLYPSGIFTDKASLFPQNLSWLRPLATTSMAVSVPNKLWLGALSAAQNKDYLLKGGVRTKGKNFPLSTVQHSLPAILMAQLGYTMLPMGIYKIMLALK